MHTPMYTLYIIYRSKAGCCQLYTRWVFINWCGSIQRRVRSNAVAICSLTLNITIWGCMWHSLFSVGCSHRLLCVPVIHSELTTWSLRTHNYAPTSTPESWKSHYGVWLSPTSLISTLLLLLLCAMCIYAHDPLSLSLFVSPFFSSFVF